jgi:hypothetical protein
MRSDFYTPYETFEQLVLLNTGKLYASGISGTPNFDRLMCQSFINTAIHYINTSFTVINNKNVLITSGTPINSGVYYLDLINDCGIEYETHVDLIYIYKTTENKYKSPLKYVTPKIYLASYLPIINDSTNTPSIWTMFEGRYLYFYPKSDNYYPLYLVYDKLVPNFINFTGVSPFENEYDSIIVTIATGFFYLAMEEIEIGKAWVDIGNAMLNKKTLTFSIPSNMAMKHQISSASSSKTWTDPSVEED